MKRIEIVVTEKTNVNRVPTKLTVLADLNDINTLRKIALWAGDEEGRIDGYSISDAVEICARIVIFASKYIIDYVGQMGFQWADEIGGITGENECFVYFDKAIESGAPWISNMKERMNIDFTDVAEEMSVFESRTFYDYILNEICCGRYVYIAPATGYSRIINTVE